MVKYTEPNIKDKLKRTEKEDKLLSDMIYDYMEKNKASNKKEMDKRYRPEDYTKE